MSKKNGENMKLFSLLGVLFKVAANATVEYRHETIDCSTGANRIERIIQYHHENQHCLGNPNCSFSRSTITEDNFSVTEDAKRQSRPRDPNLYLVSPHATLDITQAVCNSKGTSPRALKSFWAKISVKFDDGSSQVSDSLCTCFVETQLGH